MTSNAMSPVFDLGEAARVALEFGSGRTLCVLERSLYLMSGAGDLACVAARRLGRGPLQICLADSAELPWKRVAVETGAPWRFDGRTLQLAERTVFDLSWAQPWHPRPIPGDTDSARLTEGLWRLARLSRERAPEAGLGRLIPQLVASCESPDEGSWISTDLQAHRVATFAAAKLGRTFSRSGFDEHGLTEAAVGLLGLGPGLTPSGDDFVGGLVIALRELGLSSLADRIGHRIMPELAVRTNSVSAAHLRWAVSGTGSEALHDTFRALCGHADRDTELNESLTTLGDVGHCSGWDAVAGIVLGCVVWLDESRRRTPC